MLNKKSVDDINVKGQKVLVRCDFNVPLQDGKITDENRLVAALPTIKKLVADGGKIILCSHLGKPKGEPKPELSLAPVAKRLTELLGQEVKFVPSPVVVDDTVKAAVADMKDGEIILLENTRYRAEAAGQVCDILQIPAFLCRQTDLLVAAAHTGKTVNIKKAQFLSGRDMKYPVEKALESGAKEVWLTERGNSFGYNNLVVDFRNIPDMKEIVPTVIMDCTHSVQRPSAGNGKTVGDRKFVPAMAMAAKAFGATGYFFEVHPDPDNGKSDAANMLELDKLEVLIADLLA